jgi:23S rRNA pseudouridine1911/1915/1917 synthase
VSQAPRTLTADRGDAGKRLDLVVRRHLTDVPAATRTQVQSWIEDGQVTVNGTLVRRTSTRAAFGDIITVALPDAAITRRARGATPGNDTPLDVIYEDEDLLAVNKPAGTVAHPTFRNASGTILNALVGYARRWPDGRRPSLAGRLDKDTSGVVLVAKTAAIHAALQRTTTEKDYLAVVHGRVNRARGEIAAALAVDPGDRRRMTGANGGAASLTLFERLDRVPAPGPAVSLLRCRLVTGRRHQIRVHLAEHGWPIVGDPVYGAPRERRTAEPAPAAITAFPRQALHAWRTAFPHPTTGERIEIEAAIPADITDLLRVSGLKVRLKPDTTY